MGGIIGLLILFGSVIILVVGLFFLSMEHDPSPILRFIIMAAAYIWAPGHYLGQLIPGTGCTGLGNVNFRCDNEGALGAILANPIFYFVLGSIGGCIYSKIKNKGRQAI